MKLYKIRRKNDGLFVEELYYHLPMSFSEIGRFFDLPTLEEYFNNTLDDDQHSISQFEGCEVIEFDVEATNNKSNPGQLHFEKMIFGKI